MELPVPELGEGIEQATVVRVLVAPGMAVEEGQDLLEVETEKSTMPIPSPMAGIVDRINVKTGDKVRIGDLALSIIPRNDATAPTAPSVRETSPPPVDSPTIPSTLAAEERESKWASTSSRVEVVLPDLGEGIAGGTVVNVLVKPGASVEPEQPLVEVETEKASFPVPSPAEGTIEQVKVQAGDPVKVGQVLLIMQASNVSESLSSKQSARAERSHSEGHADVPATTVFAAAKPPVGETVPISRGKAAVSESSPSDGNRRPPMPASPATRRLARELGVDLQQVVGSGRGSRVTMEDVKAFVRILTTKGPARAPTASSVTVPPLPDFSRYGPIERKPFSALRKTIARNLHWSWSLAPQVTQHDLADITELETSRKSFVEAAPKGAPKVTMTVLAIKACVAALKAFPHFNASYDPNAGENGELVIKKYYHIGIAVDTERGLVVPVIRDADQKSIGELAKEVAQLAEKARAGKLMPDEMRGGTFTITNLGGIGGTAFSPIINYPEVAILGLSRSTWQPVVRDGRVEPRLMLPLSLTYDHRVIDGADGARFCARLVALFSDPIRMFFES